MARLLDRRALTALRRRGSWSLARAWAAVTRRPVRTLPRRLIHAARWTLTDTRRRSRVRRGAARVDRHELERLVRPHSPREVWRRLCSRPVGVAGADAEAPPFGEQLRALHPGRCAAILEAAEAACDHRFDLLGSGPVPLGPAIDWSLDFKSGFRWPAGYYADLQPVDLSNPADVKVPWELSRCAHFVTLAQAYRLTGDPRFPREIAAQWDAWIEQNPVMESINWANAMEAALRAANWLWSVGLVGSATAFDDQRTARYLASLVEHGRFIRDNLELIPGEPAGNHYLADLVGLVYLGVLLPEVREARAWREEGLGRLLAEVERQFLPDGVNAEYSTSYHRFTTELVASAFAVAVRHGHPVPERALAALARALEFVVHYTRPDGTAPLIGDSDDGRLHGLTPAPPNDHRPVLGLGGGLVESPFLHPASDAARHEAAWWWGVAAASPSGAPVRALRSRAFPDAGIYVMREGELFLIAACGRPPLLTGHSHNDELAFEVADGAPWLVDAGSYVYSASEHWRNHFRSAGAHNTLVVDGQESNPIAPGALFRLEATSRPAVARWESNDAFDLLDARHHGYARLPGAVVHRRRFYFDKRAGYWLVEDSLLGAGEHRVQASFHFAPGVDLRRSGPGVALARRGDGRTLSLGWADLVDPRVTIGDGWVSASYGRREAAPVLRLEWSLSVPATWTWRVCPRAAPEGAASGLPDRIPVG